MQGGGGKDTAALNAVPMGHTWRSRAAHCGASGGRPRGSKGAHHGAYGGWQARLGPLEGTVRNYRMGAFSFDGATPSGGGGRHTTTGGETAGAGRCSRRAAWGATHRGAL